MISIALKPKLYGTPSRAPARSQGHPDHWRPAAEAGDTQAMVQIGIIYHRARDHARALEWYRRAAEAGDALGQQRLDQLETWLARPDTVT